MFPVTVGELGGGVKAEKCWKSVTIERSATAIQNHERRWALPGTQDSPKSTQTEEVHLARR
jgi:hypothetical protein